MMAESTRVDATFFGTFAPRPVHDSIAKGAKHVTETTV